MQISIVKKMSEFNARKAKEKCKDKNNKTPLKFFVKPKPKSVKLKIEK